MNALERIEANLAKHRATMVHRTPEEMRAYKAENQRQRRQKIRDGGYTVRGRRQRLPESTSFSIRQRWLNEGYYLPDEPMKFTPMRPQQPTEYRGNLLNYIHAALTRAEVIEQMRFHMTTEAAGTVLLEEGVYFPIT